MIFVNIGTKDTISGPDIKGNILGVDIELDDCHVILYQ
jgi:hypothetical protein